MTVTQSSAAANMTKVYKGEIAMLTKNLNKAIRDCAKETKIHQRHLNAVRKQTDREIAKCSRILDGYSKRILRRIQILEGRLS